MRSRDRLDRKVEGDGQREDSGEMVVLSQSGISRSSASALEDGDEKEKCSNMAAMRAVRLSWYSGCWQVSDSEQHRSVLGQVGGRWGLQDGNDTVSGGRKQGDRQQLSSIVMNGAAARLGRAKVTGENSSLQVVVFLWNFPQKASGHPPIRRETGPALSKQARPLRTPRFVLEEKVFGCLSSQEPCLPRRVCRPLIDVPKSDDPVVVVPATCYLAV